MVSLTTPICEFGLPAVDFLLAGTNGQTYDLKKIRGEKGLLVMFICNHCPYVRAILPRLVKDTKQLKDMHGINSIAIMSNDPNEYKEDSFKNMKKVAMEMNFSFPYVWDETQEVAKMYGAVCTPDFFGYNAKLKLQYRGRFNASRKTTAEGEVRQDLFLAMQEISMTQRGPIEQIPSMGCSIKWRST